MWIASARWVTSDSMGEAPVEPAGKIFFRPDILADGDAEFHPGDFDGRDDLRRLEIAILVEDIVSRQQRFVDFAEGLPAREDRGGVVEGPSGPGVDIDEPDDERHIADRRVQFLKNLQIQRNKARLEDEILRRVTGERQLRGEHDLRATGNEITIRREDLFRVSAEVTNGRIKLGEADFHVTAQSAPW